MIWFQGTHFVLCLINFQGTQHNTNVFLFWWVPEDFDSLDRSPSTGESGLCSFSTQMRRLDGGGWVGSLNEMGTYHTGHSVGILKVFGFHDISRTWSYILCWHSHTGWNCMIVSEADVGWWKIHRSNMQSRTGCCLRRPICSMKLKVVWTEPHGCHIAGLYIICKENSSVRFDRFCSNLYKRRIQGWNSKRFLVQRKLYGSLRWSLDHSWPRTFCIHAVFQHFKRCIAFRGVLLTH